MPRGKKPETNEKPAIRLQPRKDAKDDEWGGFVQISLSPMDKAIFDTWYSEHIQHVQPLLDQHVGLGLKLSVVFDGANNSYIASYTGRPNTDEGLPFRCTLSARAGEFMEAVALLVYKEQEVASGDWSGYLINGTKVTNWG